MLILAWVAVLKGKHSKIVAVHQLWPFSLKTWDFFFLREKKMRFQRESLNSDLLKISFVLVPAWWLNRPIFQTLKTSLLLKIPVQVLDSLPGVGSEHFVPWLQAANSQIAIPLPDAGMLGNKEGCNQVNYIIFFLNLWRALLAIRMLDQKNLPSKFSSREMFIWLW